MNLEIPDEEPPNEAPLEWPTTTYQEECRFGLTTAVRGRLGDIELDHAFCRIELRYGRNDGMQGLDGGFGGDGYLFALGTAPLERAIGKVSRGLLRLPSITGDGGDWYCIDHAIVQSVDEQTQHVRIDRLSRLSGQVGSVALRGERDAEIASPVNYLNLGTWGYRQVGSADTFVQLAVDASRELGGSGWHLLGFRPDASSGSHAPPVTDAMLVDYGDEKTPPRLSFPGPGSSFTEHEASVSVELSGVSAPVSCGGTPIDGNVELFVRLGKG